VLTGVTATRECHCDGASGERSAGESDWQQKEEGSALAEMVSATVADGHRPVADWCGKLSIPVDQSFLTDYQVKSNRRRFARYGKSGWFIVPGAALAALPLAWPPAPACGTLGAGQAAATDSAEPQNILSDK
jgi:hypothetical protein